MGLLKDRVIDLQVDTIKIKGVTAPSLRVSFKATKTLKPKPNTCEITIYNLNQDHRSGLTKVKHPVVQLSAGYENDLTQVFYRQAVHVLHERKDPDILTTISTSDGGPKLQTARIKQSFGPGAKAGDVLRAIVKTLGVKVGNLDATVRKLNSGKAASIFLEGATLSGHAPYELSALCRSAGLEWSIQDGVIQFLDVGRTAAKFATVLDEDLLLSTPSLSDKNVVESDTFLQKDFLPGRQVQIKSEFVTGAFRLEKCEYRGDTHGDDWAVHFEAKGPKPP